MKIIARKNRILNNHKHDGNGSETVFFLNSENYENIGDLQPEKQ
jgi:hypothetical protein